MRCGDVFLDFQDTCGRDAPHAQLADFASTIQTDANEVYDSLKKVIRDRVRIGCAAHSRRKFHRALTDGDQCAIWFIAQFRELYRIDREAKSLPPENRHQHRQQQAVQIWADLLPGRWKPARPPRDPIRPAPHPAVAINRRCCCLTAYFETTCGWIGELRFGAVLFENGTDRRKRRGQRGDETPSPIDRAFDSDR